MNEVIRQALADAGGVDFDAPNTVIGDAVLARCRRVEPERCEDCGRPVSTPEDAKLYAGGEGEHLCWGCEPPSPAALREDLERLRGERDAKDEALRGLLREMLAQQHDIGLPAELGTVDDWARRLEAVLPKASRE